jgi:hypothetical protein
MSGSCPLSIPVMKGNMKSLTELLEQNKTSAEAVRVLCPLVGSETEKYDPCERFSAIGRILQNIQTITFTVIAYYWGGCWAFLHAPALGCLLQLRSQTLRSVCIDEFVKLEGTKEEYLEAFRVLSTCNALQHFTFTHGGIFITEGTNTEDTAEGGKWVVGSLIDSLARIETLESLQIHATIISSSLQSPLAKFCRRPPGSGSFHLRLSSIDLSGEFLSLVCSNNSRITTLGMRDIPVSNEHAKSMAAVLRSNETMTDFKVSSSGLQAPAAIMLLEALRENTCLKTMSIKFCCCKGFEYTEPMVEAIQKMSSLKKLKLTIIEEHPQRSKKSAPSLLRGLGLNTCLSHFDLVLAGKGAVNDEQLLEALSGALEKNNVLQDVSIHDIFPVQLCPDVLFWLNLNRAGRQYLERNFDDRVRWVEAIISQKNDVAFTHYLLSRNPLLCQSIGELPAPSNNDGGPGKKRRVGELKRG